MPQGLFRYESRASLDPPVLCHLFSRINICFICRPCQIAGAYPGLTREEFFAVQSEPAAIVGQWTYDFSDPDGPQLGTVAIDGSDIVTRCEDPVVIIAEHTSLAVPLPESIKEPVDLILLVDRAQNRFAERRFLVMDVAGSGVMIGAFASKQEMPSNAEILGHVVLCQIPWLPSMKPTKSGFLEADEYF
jgi:Rubisco Assembly chaperone C-terminal domain